MTHAQTVCTRPFFFLPRSKRARLPMWEKEGLGTRLVFAADNFQEPEGPAVDDPRA